MRKQLIQLVAIVGLVSNLSWGDALPDFAVYEDSGECAKNFPAQVREALKPTNQDDIAEKFKALSQEQLNLLYSCSSAPKDLPLGFHRGGVIFPHDGGHKVFIEFLNKLGAPIDDEKLNKFAELLWKGKEFFAEPDGSHSLANEVALKLRFPAKVYPHLSILDARKDSLIIDYAYSDDFTQDNDRRPHYQGIDILGTRKGLLIRDEIREIAPGLYLGRAYMGGFFGLNFVLYKS